jgi:hypothetical protein
MVGTTVVVSGKGMSGESRAERDELSELVSGNICMDVGGGKHVGSIPW